MFTIRKSKKLGKNMSVNFSSKSGVGLSGGVGPLRFNTKRGKKKTYVRKNKSSFFDTLLGFVIIVGIIAFFIS